MIHDGWMGGGGWLVVIVPLVIVAFVLLLGRGVNRRRPPEGGRSDPEDVLKTRLARGEIDEEEYRSRLEALRRE